MRYQTLLLVFMLSVANRLALAQSAAPQTAALPASTSVQQRFDSLSALIVETKTRLEESQRQIQQLQTELDQLREQVASGATPAVPSPPVAFSTTLPGTAQSTSTMEERQDALEAAVRTEQQIKIESSSRYPVRFRGLLLFNAFLNKGVPDNSDLPAVALRPSATSGDGSLGAGLRQTILGVEGEGPIVAGAQTSAAIDFDFYSSVSYSGYGTSAGVVRMRTAKIAMDWPRDHLELGMQPPLISPLSPTSYATVAEPALAGAGNLWTWSPQLRFAHQFGDLTTTHFQAELGLWDSPAAGYNPNELFRSASPSELARQPAYEARLSFLSPQESGLQLGASGYYSRQAYPGYAGVPGTEHVDSWVAALDFRIPLTRHFELSGEAYRGRSLGGLGGGVYKDAVQGINPRNGTPEMKPLQAVGGWAQAKTRLASNLEVNVSSGLDNGFASDFHALILPPTTSNVQLRARNQMAVANLIYRPKTYLILSPEYRRISSWPIAGPANTLHIVTFSAGYQF